PEAMPVTQWFDDSVPALIPEEWSLTARSASGDRTWSYATLERFDDRVIATLDCTGGWFAEQEWEGVWLSRLLDGADARSVAVTSLTGYGRVFPVRDVGGLLLATRVGGMPLSAGHGSPARLVAPGRRGFWWVKWATHIETTDRPWWLQPPFPLT
ncbi:MAG: molybdopterin-dependent oxidoreductase, partial [Actinobacteria bacterium]|nr:molybdopterin-dependent oxidoreductase [Actinomycetota bacterium]